MRVTGRVWCTVLCLLVPLAAEAQRAPAKKKGPPPPAARKPPAAEGVALAARYAPDKGFVDDVFAFDGAGGRLAVVRTDGSAFAEVEILDLGRKGASAGTFDLSPHTTAPARIDFVGDGARLLVTARGGDEKVSAWVLDLSGKLVRRFGPATDVALTEIGGVEAVAVFDAREDTRRGGFTYDVTFLRIADGRPVGRRRTLVADAEGFVKNLDLSVLYWQGGYTRLVGRKRGGYDRTKDQRMNDGQAIYDVVAGAIARNAAVEDLIAWAAVVKLRAERPNVPAFLLVTEDLRGLELFTADDRRVPVKVAEPFSRYDSKSLVQELGRDGRIWFSLTIDPVNPAAVARKVSDPEIVDLYVVEAGGGEARRVARLPRTDRPFGWRVSTGRWAVLRKHRAFARGGTELEIYDLTR
jgi:hypothetical protein